MLTMAVGVVDTDCPASGYSIEFTDASAASKEIWITDETVGAAVTSNLYLGTGSTVGTYTVAFKAEYISKSLTNEEIMTLKITVVTASSCTVTSIIWGFTEFRWDYVLGSNDKTRTATFTQDPACGYVVTAVTLANDISSHFTLASSTISEITITADDAQTTAFNTATIGNEMAVTFQTSVPAIRNVVTQASVYFYFQAVDCNPNLYYTLNDP